MKLTGFAVLLAVALALPVTSQTLSGHIDTGGDWPTNSSGHPKQIECPGASVGGWQATLRLRTNSFQVGNNIDAEIVIKNVSTNDLKFSAAWPLLANGFRVQILDKNKAEIPLSSFGKSQKSSGSASPNISDRIPPGKEMVFSLELRKLYRLESLGTYSIQAFAMVPSPDTTKRIQLATEVAHIIILPGADLEKN